MTEFGRFSDYMISTWINEVLAKDLYAGLGATNPFIAGGPSWGEVSGTHYVRLGMAVALDGGGFNMLSNTEVLQWVNLPAGISIRWLLAFDDHLAGHLIAAAPLAAPIDLPDGGSQAFEPGDFALGLDVATGP